MGGPMLRSWVLLLAAHAAWATDASEKDIVHIRPGEQLSPEVDRLFRDIAKKQGATSVQRPEDLVFKKIADEIAQGDVDKFKKPFCRDDLTAVAKPGSHQLVTNGQRAQQCAKRFPNYEGFQECAIYNHDACLLTCGTGFDRCTELFEKCLHGVCENDHGDDGGLCKEGVAKLIQLIRMLGGIGFKNAQKAGCQCVQSEQAVSRHEEELVSFYEHWAPDRISKVPDLVKKHAGKESFPYVMLSLRQKYKKSVTVVPRSEADVKVHEEAVKRTAKAWSEKMKAKDTIAASSGEYVEALIPNHKSDL